MIASCEALGVIPLNMHRIDRKKFIPCIPEECRWERSWLIMHSKQALSPLQHYLSDLITTNQMRPGQISLRPFCYEMKNRKPETNRLCFKDAKHYWGGRKNAKSSGRSRLKKQGGKNVILEFQSSKNSCVLFYSSNTRMKHSAEGPSCGAKGRTSDLQIIGLSLSISRVFFFFFFSE